MAAYKASSASYQYPELHLAPELALHLKVVFIHRSYILEVHPYYMKNSNLQNLSINQKLYNTIISGCNSSLISTFALLLRSKNDNNSYFAAINAVSHWLYGDEAFVHKAPDISHTIPGYAIHHVSATLWAGVYENWFPPETDKASHQIVTDALKVAALACFVDYKLTPHRLQPGYEAHLSTKSLAIVYGTFAFGLALRQLAKQKP